MKSSEQLSGLLGCQLGVESGKWSDTWCEVKLRNNEHRANKIGRSGSTCEVLADKLFVPVIINTRSKATKWPRERNDLI